MSITRDSVLKKFRSLPTSTKQMRRLDYKGQRYRINLRIGIHLAIQLQLLKMATGEDKNTYCERVLGEAIEREIAAVRAKYDDTVWQTMAAHAARKARA